MIKQVREWDRLADYVIDFAIDRLRASRRVALVTLVKIEGSSPRPLGAQMAVADDGEWVGYLSGGCIERAVVAEALSAIEQGQTRRVRYGRGSKYMDVQLPCGSAIELVFDVHASEHELAAIDARMCSRRLASLCIPGDIRDFPTQVMIRNYYPQKRLIVAGVGPSAVQLVRLAALSDFDAVLHSPDSATLHAAKPDEISTFAINNITDVPDFHADRNSAIVFMFHDHEWEQKLIPAALKTEAFYIGAMGSIRTHHQRLEALERRGISPVTLRRIRGPAGLFSAAKSAPEIAVSILAEILQDARSENIQGQLLDELSALHLTRSSLDV